MPAQTETLKINLLSKDTIAQTAEARIVNWALTYGRYIMIGTEIVVLLAFISRFSLDRKRTDLREEIQQKQAILQANLPFENDIRKTQESLAKLKTLLADQKLPVNLVTTMSTLLPADVFYKELDITKDKLQVQAVAGTSEGFSQFLANLLAARQLTNIEISDISKSSTTGITFTFNATTVTPKTK
jgi:Tfp pilus assembly protein PilN